MSKSLSGDSHGQSSPKGNLCSAARKLLRDTRHTLYRLFWSSQEWDAENFAMTEKGKFPLNLPFFFVSPPKCLTFGQFLFKEAERKVVPKEWETGSVQHKRKAEEAQEKCSKKEGCDLGLPSMSILFSTVLLEKVAKRRFRWTRQALQESGNAFRKYKARVFERLLMSDVASPHLQIWLLNCKVHKVLRNSSHREDCVATEGKAGFLPWCMKAFVCSSFGSLNLLEWFPTLEVAAM